MQVASGWYAYTHSFTIRVVLTMCWLPIIHDAIPKACSTLPLPPPLLPPLPPPPPPLAAYRPSRYLILCPTVRNRRLRLMSGVLDIAINVPRQIVPSR
ncbi:hypothetical protein M0802_016236 [Mischocyttarus mexicanus]|nr:hypothetical protein M0802_016236 [Mischocyttarus mexicanus]